MSSTFSWAYKENKELSYGVLIGFIAGFGFSFALTGMICYFFLGQGV